jgi:ADP-ribose pyrophosphatase YjhB (NUDIX family)
MFEFFQSKTKRLQNKIDKYISIEREQDAIKSSIDELAETFQERKIARDSIIKSQSDDEIKLSVESRYDSFITSHLKEIGDLRRHRDDAEKSLNNLIKGDEEFVGLVETEKFHRQYRTVLTHYRNDEISLEDCDTLLKAVQHKYLRKELKNGEWNYIYDDDKEETLSEKFQRIYDEKHKKEIKHKINHKSELKTILDNAQISNVVNTSHIYGSEYWTINGESFRVADHSKHDEKLYKEGVNDFRSYDDLYEALSKKFDLSDKNEQEQEYKKEAKEHVIKREDGLFKVLDGSLFGNIENAVGYMWEHKTELAKIKKSFESELFKANKIKYSDNLVFNEKGQLLLLKRSEVIDFMPGHFALPGGHVDPGEDFETAAKRELFEESGIKSENTLEVGEFENDDVHIKYYRTDVVDVEPVLEEREAWSYEWVDPTKLDECNPMMDNMRDNIIKILYPEKHKIITIKKSFESGEISESVKDELLKSVIEKAKSGIYKITSENKKLGRVGQKYGDSKKEDKYKNIKDYAEQVIRGEKHLERLSPEEEQGRIEGGKINVEATLILGRSKETESEFPQREKQLKILEKFAKSSDCWIEDYEKTYGVENRFDKATESEVFYDNKGSVIKINNFSQHEDLSEMFDRVALQNLLFPDAKYEVLGFTKRDGELNVIMKQPFIDMKKDEKGEVILPSKKELSEEMKKLGYEDQGGNMFSSKNYLIEDLHSANVCYSKEGILMFIDPVLRLNLKSEGYGGDRELGKIKFEKSEESNLEKAEAKWKNTDEKGDLSVDDLFTQKFDAKSRIFVNVVKKYLDDKWNVKTKDEFDEKFKKESKLKEVGIEDIIPTQKYVSKKIMDEKMDNVHFKESNIQIFKFDGKYYLYDGHHRTSAMIKEGFKEVKDNVLNLRKIKDFEKDIEEFLPKKFDLYEVVDKSEESDLEKATHKYIKKEPDGKGGWNYIYEESEEIKDDNLSVIEKKKNLKESKSIVIYRSTHESGKNFYTGNKELPFTYYSLTKQKAENYGIPESFIFNKNSEEINVFRGDLFEKFGKPVNIEEKEVIDTLVKEGFSAAIVKGDELVVFDKNKIFKKDVKKSVTSTLNKAFKDNLINEEQYTFLLEKAWKKQQVGTIVTRKDGRKYKKVSETGNTAQDWKLVSKDKTQSADDKYTRSGGSKEEVTDNKPSKKELKEHAKNTSETALTNAVKQSADPVERQTAHEELKRREEEEKPKEEEKMVGGEKKKTVKKETVKKEENQYVEKFRALSDEQVRFYLAAPYEDVKKAAKIIFEERGLKVIDEKDYIKGFRDRSDVGSYTLRQEYEKESESVKNYLEKNKEIAQSLKQYIGQGYQDIRSLLSDGDKFRKEEMPGTVKAYESAIKEISKFINDNKIEEDISLNRRVYGQSDFFQKLKKGDVYEDKSFSSTSLKELSNFGSFNIKILAKKGSNVASVNNPGEYEYLIDKGVKFRVLERGHSQMIVELL